MIPNKKEHDEWEEALAGRLMQSDHSQPLAHIHKNMCNDKSERGANPLVRFALMMYMFGVQMSRRYRDSIVMLRMHSLLWLAKSKTFPSLNIIIRIFRMNHPVKMFDNSIQNNVNNVEAPASASLLERNFPHLVNALQHLGGGDQPERRLDNWHNHPSLVPLLQWLNAFNSALECVARYQTLPLMDE